VADGSIFVAKYRPDYKYGVDQRVKSTVTSS
jgi:hypothetical protein